MTEQEIQRLWTILDKDRRTSSEAKELRILQEQWHREEAAKRTANPAN